jgi:hypothetical protein
MDRKEFDEISTAIEDSGLSTDENDVTAEDLARIEADAEEQAIFEDDENDYEDEDKDDEDDYDHGYDLEDEDEDEDEEDDDECEVIQVTETRTIVQQPIITSVMVGAEVDGKGVVKPVCKVSIERHIDPETTEIDEFDIISGDFEKLTEEVKMQIISLREKVV